MRAGRVLARVEDSGTESIRLPPMSPNLNAYSERFARSIKEECLGKMIFVGEASLRRAICEFMSHYHEERNHQGLDNTLIQAESRDAMDAANDAFIHRRQRLGGNPQLLLPSNSLNFATENLDTTGKH